MAAQSLRDAIAFEFLSTPINALTEPLRGFWCFCRSTSRIHSARHVVRGLPRLRARLPVAITLPMLTAQPFPRSRPSGELAAATISCSLKPVLSRTWCHEDSPERATPQSSLSLSRASQERKAPTRRTPRSDRDGTLAHEQSCDRPMTAADRCSQSGSAPLTASLPTRSPRTMRSKVMRSWWNFSVRLTL